MKLTINAILTTLSPLHIASGKGGARLDTTKWRADYSDSASFPTCTLVQRLGVASDSDLSEDNQRVAKINNLPVITANNIAGRLRRHAAKHFLEALRQKDQTVSIGTYNALMCGAVTGNPDGEDVLYKEFVTTSKHPYLGLFGGGPRMIPRRVRVHNALPVTSVTNALSGNLRHPMANNYEQDEVRNNGFWLMTRNDDLQELADISNQAANITNYEEEIQKRQATIMDEKKMKPKSKTSTDSYTSLEFVVPNINFGLVFELDVDNQAQVGLFLSALNSFVQSERIGGHSRNGFGRFALNDVIITDEDGNQHTGIFNNNVMDADNDLVADCLKAWDKAGADVEADEIEHLLRPPAEKTAKKGKKAEAA